MVAVVLGEDKTELLKARGADHVVNGDCSADELAKRIKAAAPKGARQRLLHQNTTLMLASNQGHNACVVHEWLCNR